MNFIETTIAESGGALYAETAGLRVRIPADRTVRLAPYKGQAVALGIRPEDLREATGSDSRDTTFEAVVEVAEPLGAEILLDTRVGNQTVVARVDPTVRTRHHEKIWLAFIPDRIHFFDNHTDEAIARGKSEYLLPIVGNAMLTDALVAEAQARVLSRVDATAAEVGAGFPHVADGQTGRWEVKPEGSWTGGFWVGCCWLAHALTGAQRYRTWGIEWAQRLRGRERDLTHDIGFLFQYAAVLGWETVREPALRDLALAAADQLVAMSHPRARVIPVGARAEVSAGPDDVTIDCLMNLQLLWWAARETDTPLYRAVALAHAERTAAWHVRLDGSCFQSVHFDPDTGESVKKHTHQGYSPDGCWSRGLGWCAYGFLEAFRATDRTDFLDIASQAVRYHLRRMPEDGVPFYDYDDPRIPHVPRDSSAAAILASACLGLAQIQQNRGFREAAERILEGLIRSYLTPVGPHDRRPPGMLLHGCYNRQTGEAPDHELIWGDYFLLEALTRWQQRSRSGPGSFGHSSPSGCGVATY